CARRSLAVRFTDAQRRATVEGFGVAVVAALGALDYAVAAFRGRTNAWFTLTLHPTLDLATLRAAVSGLDVAIVALFRPRADAVATTRDLAPRLTRRCTAVSGCDGET